MLLLRFADRYCETHLTLAANSAEQLRIAVRRLEDWAGRSVACQELSAGLVISFLSHLLRMGQSPATARGKRTSILTLWRAAAREGLAPPVEDVPPIRQPQRLPEAWTIEEIGRLLKQCREVRGRVGPCRASDWWTSLCLTVYDTGERIGALRAVASTDFLPESSCVIVRYSHQKGRRDRVLAISAQTIAALLKIHNPERELLFPWPWRPETLWVRFRKIVEAAGLQAPKRKMSLFHKIRRTSGSYVRANGGCGWLHLGNTQAVFQRSYDDPRIGGRGQLEHLPRPEF